MNLRLAKKIVQCKSSLYKDYDRVVEARNVMENSNLSGWYFFELSREDHATAIMVLNNE